MPASFVRPELGSVAGTLSAALDAVGLTTPGSKKNREIFGFPRVERVCFVLVDGLGVHNLEARCGHARTLCSLDTQTITSVVPSTTAASITSVGTGLLPGQTAMIGYSLRSPVSGKAFSLIKWEESGLEPRDWQRKPTLFERLGEQSERCRLVQPRAFIGSGLTEAALRGAKAMAAETLEERVDAAVQALRSGISCVYLYWGDVDHVGHNRGCLSDDWSAELEKFDSAIGALLRRLPKDTMLVVTADHGMLDTVERIDVSQRPELLRGVELMVGEDRAIQLHCDDPGEVRARWASALGDKSWVLTRDEAIDEGLFGKVEDHTRSVMGDVIAFQTGTVTILDSRLRKTGSPMVGVHGSLTPDEMLVPLIVEIV